MIIKKEVNYDLECKNPPVIEIGSHELNVESFSLVISLYQNYKKLEFDSGDTVTAALVSGGILIDSERECTIKDNKVTLDITNKKNETATVKAGRMLVELSIKTSTNEVYVLPTAFIVRVEKSILDNAIVTEDSVGSVAEVIKEVVAARDIYPNLGKRLDEKTNYKTVSYNAGGTGGLNTACDPDTIYYVYFQIACNNVPQGTRGILFATDENTQILISDKGNIYYRKYDTAEDVWGEFTSIISKKVNSVNGIAPDEFGNIDLLVECGYGTDLANCTDKSKIYYFHSGIEMFGDPGYYIGFVKKINNGWLFISSGEGQVKANYRILENGELKLIGSTNDYNDLINKPKVNNVELTGNKTLDELGLYTKEQVDEIIANQSVSGSGTLQVITQSVINSNSISSATYYYVKQGELVTLFVSIKFNEGNCNYSGFNNLPFNYNNKAGQLRVYTTSSTGNEFSIRIDKYSILYIESSVKTRKQDEELNFSITYTTNS